MSLAHLGQTRSARWRDHLLQTPETFVRTVLPGMRRATAIVHASPAIGAAFAQYTAEMEAGGVIAQATAQRFIYVLEGAITAAESVIHKGGYCVLPHGHDSRVEAQSNARLVVIEKPYKALPSVPSPGLLLGRESDIALQRVGEDDSVMVGTLIPDDVSYDFAVNTMTYQPGGSLSLVEIHVMEHGLVMLEGGGIYRLSECWYPVSAGDFIWMAPYCPQWFGAIGKVPAKYLIYKDSNRSPL